MCLKIFKSFYTFFAEKRPVKCKKYYYFLSKKKIVFVLGIVVAGTAHARSYFTHFAKTRRFTRVTVSACRSGWARTIVRVSVDNTYEVCSKNKVNFQISRAMYIRFSIFFPYVGTLLPNVCSQFQQYSIFFCL